MKNILFILIAVFVANSAIAQYTSEQVDSIEGRTVWPESPSKTDGVWVKSESDGLYYFCLTTETGVEKDSLSTEAEAKEVVLGWVDEQANIDIVRESALYNGDVVAVTSGFDRHSIGGQGLNDGWVRYNSFVITKDTTVAKIRIGIYTAGVFTDDGSMVGIYSVADDGAMALVTSGGSGGDFLKTKTVVDIPVTSVRLPAGRYAYAIYYNQSAQTTAPYTTASVQGLSSSNIWGKALFGSSADIVIGWRSGQTGLDATMNTSDITSSGTHYDAVICTE